MTVLFDLRGADVYYGPVHALREAEVRICAGEP